MSGSVMWISCGLVGWGACLVGALSIAQWPGDLGHAICGPWGCGPPLQALIACHLAWLVALAPPAIWFIAYGKLPRGALQKTGILLIVLSAAALTTIAVHQWLVWLPQVDEWRREFFWQRYGFTIVTAVDFPIVQMLLIGTALWVASLRNGALWPRSSHHRRNMSFPRSSEDSFGLSRVESKSP